MNNNSSKAFTHYVINQIKSDVRRSLTKVQLDEIKKAVSASTPLKEHPLDIRGIIPLFFFRFYFVFLLGRDHRRVTKRTEGLRRKETDLWASITFFIIFTLPLLILGFFVIYFIKTELGINLFSEFHLIDVLNLH
ncbi:MAG: hypothetical protein KZQ83_15685 [gamma proteobacterium symbiont of Taylorina sp.]|nr:hypothetical protein [gamma proteobacterium symbiont of Taylorina sp.]